MRKLQSGTTSRGSTLVYAMIAIVPLIGIMSLGVDYGRVQMAKTELQRCADAAARAGASGLGISTTEARNRAAEYCSLNPVDGVTITLNPNTDIVFGSFNSDTRTFTALAPADYAQANAIQVNLRRTGANALPLLFAPIIGKNTCEISASSITSIDGGDAPAYIGLSLTRMYNSTRFDGYNSAVGSYGGSNIRTDQTIYGANNLLLDGSAYVNGKAKYGPTGTLSKDSSATVTGGITRNTEQITKPPVSLGNVATVNDNASINAYLSGGSKTELILGQNVNRTLPGGTYYLTKLDLDDNSTLRFTSSTTIYLNGSGKIQGRMGHTSWRPSYLKLNVANGNNVSIDNYGEFYGILYNPQGDVHHHGNGESFGGVISDLLCFRNNAKGHADTSAAFGAGEGGSIKTVR